MKVTKDMVGKELNLLVWDEKMVKHHVYSLNPALRQVGNGLYLFTMQRNGYFEDLLEGR